ncbi:transposase [Kitasatospora sp. NPDC094028]
MRQYETIIDLLNHQGPGLQDYVTPDQLDQLINGTLPIGDIADDYLDDLANSTVTVATSPEATRADLLGWIRAEIDNAIEQRKEDAQQASLDALGALAHADTVWAAGAHRRKLDAIAEAQQRGATKDAIARNLGITRPTLDEWIRNREDRILFNGALAIITHPNVTTADSKTLGSLYKALGVRSISTQAEAVLEGMHHIDKNALRPEQSDLIFKKAVPRAWQLVDHVEQPETQRQQAAALREDAARLGLEVITTDGSAFN